LDLIVASPPASSERRAAAVTIPTTLSRVLVVVVLCELVLVYAPTVKWLFDRWTMGIWYNGHGLFIPPAVAYFSWLALRREKVQPSQSSAWGFVFLVPALIAHVLDTGIHTQLLSAISIVIALPGLSLLFLGAARTRAIAFPLAFAVFMLPIPLAVTEPLHLVLRHIATAGTTALLPLLGITVFSEGTTLHLVNGSLEVGDGCSGFSTLYAAGAVAVLSAFTCDYWRGRIQTLAAAAPIAIASNVVRVALLAVLTEWLGVDVLNTWMHPASGMMTFALSLPLIFWLGRPRREAVAA
jgi:exosortase